MATATVLLNKKRIATAILFFADGFLIPARLRDYETTGNDWEARDCLRMTENAWERLRKPGWRANKTTGPKDYETTGTTGRHDSRTSNASPPPHVAGLLTLFPIKKRLIPPPHCGSLSHFAGRLHALLPKNSSALPLCGLLSNFAGRFLPTRALSRLRDRGTTGSRDHGTTL